VPINVMAFQYIAKEKTNNATGIINLARNIGGSLGISLVTTMQARLAQKHQNMLVHNMTPFSINYQSALQSIAAHLENSGASAAEAIEQARALLYSQLQRQSSMLAFIDVFWLLGATCLAMIPLMFLMKKARPRGGPVSVH
jgi:DHA2 family multidrug resistance protein